MSALRNIFLILFSINITTFLFLLLVLSPDKRSTVELSNDETSQPEMLYEEAQHRFDDPFIAYYLLEQLDVFSTIDKSFTGRSNFTGIMGGLKPNDDYCSEHRAYFVHHPEFIFQEKNFLTNFRSSHKFRSQVIPAFGGTNIHPDLMVKNVFKPEEKYKIDLKPDVNIFYTQNLIFYVRQVGKQFACLTQAFNHIPGHDKMYRKDKVGQALVDYAKNYETRPECFNYNKYFPKTWILQRKDQCLDFFKEFLSPRYQQLKEERNVVYFRKIGADVHEGKGVFPVNDQEEEYIQKLYKNGTLCGKIKHNNLIQYNVHNLLLLQNRKFGFRMFLLVASTNPVIAYYHDGYARQSLNEYDPTSKEVITFVTNIGMNIKEAEKETGLTEEQIQESTLWLLEDFQNYLMQIGRIQDPNWLDNYLRPELKRVMLHLVRMAQDGFFKASSLFELYGLDFVMDENLELWFIEANSMPLIDGNTKRSTELLNQMSLDMLEIVFGLIRSRVKRVIEYINILSKEASYDMDAKNLEEIREEFKEISKNRFEPEFEPSAKNRFQKIIDETQIGTRRYENLISEKCL